MSIFGGGGTKCTVCNKTAYPAETISFEKKPYHFDCFRCQGDSSGVKCNKKIENTSSANAFEGKIYCTQCFQKGGFAQKQRKVVWKKKENTGASETSGKFGGGGSKCKICDKTVFAAEALQYEKQVYHAECFVCSQDDCGKKMTPSDAANFEDKLFCRKCFAAGGYTRKQALQRKSHRTTPSVYNSKFGGGGMKCEVCAKTVFAAETVSYEKKAYHPGCFTCSHVTDAEAGSVCGKKLTPSSAQALDGNLYCSKCWESGGYRRKQSELKKPAAGATGATPPNRRFSRFGGGGAKCRVCEKTVYPAELLSFEKNAFHAACFICMGETCEKKLTVSNAEGHKKDGVLASWHCKQCFQSLGLNRA